MIQRRGRGRCRATLVHRDVGGPLGSGESVEGGWALCWVSSVQEIIETQRRDSFFHQVKTLAVTTVTLKTTTEDVAY